MQVSAHHVTVATCFKFVFKCFAVSAQLISDGLIFGGLCWRVGRYMYLRVVQSVTGGDPPAGYLGPNVIMTNGSDRSVSAQVCFIAVLFNACVGGHV